MARPDDLVVGQVVVLEDDLDDRAGRVGGLDDRGDVGLDVAVAARLQGADVDDHVELGRAVLERSMRLVDLRRGRRAAVREADDGPDLDVGPGQEGSRAPDVDRPDADRGDVVAGRQSAALLDERVVELRPQQGVVDRLGDLPLGQVLDGECHVPHLMYGRRTSRARRNPRLISSSVFSKSRSSCSMITSPS
jgi:hypothetical protein